MSSETLAGILAGQELVEGEDFQLFLESVELFNPLTQWDPVRYREILDEYELFTLPDSTGFTYNPSRAQSRVQAWEQRWARL